MEPHACTALWQDGPRLTLHDSTQSVHGVRTPAGRHPRPRPEERSGWSRPYVGGGFGSKGHAARAQRAGRARRAEPPGPPGEARAHPAADVHARRLPHADPAAGPAGRRRAAAGSRRSRTRRSSRPPGSRSSPSRPPSATRSMYAGDARRTHPPAGAARRRGAVLDACAGGGPGHVRPRVGHGRARGGRRPRPGRAAGAQRAGDRPGDRAALVEPAPRGVPARRAPRGSAGTGAGTRRAPRGRLAGRPGDRGLDVPAPRACRATPRRSRTAATVATSVRIGAADIGTGSWTALTQIAADALGMPFDRVAPRDRRHAAAQGHRSRAGRPAWPRGARRSVLAGRGVPGRARHRRRRRGPPPRRPPSRPATPEYAVHSYGAQFVEARVNVDTGEVRVPRMVGVFSCGRIVNPRTARSQLIGGMSVGLSMALHEKSRRRPRARPRRHPRPRGLPRPGRTPTSATSTSTWLDEQDPHANPLGRQGHRRDRHHRHRRRGRQRGATTPPASGSATSRSPRTACCR